MASRPAVASGTLPRTGASTKVTPCGRRAATSRTVSGPTVDMSISSWPDLSAAARPSGPKTTCSSACGLATMVIAAPTPAAACAGVDATEAPRSASGRVLWVVRFQTVRSLPASSSLVAIGVPISPRPTNPSFAIDRSLLTCFGVRAPHGHRVRQDRVDLLQVGLAELNVGGRSGALKLGRPARAHDRHVHRRVGQRPGDRQLRQADATPVGNALEPLDHRQVAAEGLACEVRALGAPVVGSKVIDGRIRPDSSPWASGP